MRSAERSASPRSLGRPGIDRASRRDTCVRHHATREGAMTFRSRMSLALLVAALIPLAVLAHGVRREVTRRLTTQYERRVSTLVKVASQDLAYESASTAIRLAIL